MAGLLNDAETFSSWYILILEYFLVRVTEDDIVATSMERRRHCTDAE